MRDDELAESQIGGVATMQCLLRGSGTQKRGPSDWLSCEKIEKQEWGSHQGAISFFQFLRFITRINKYPTISL